MRLLVFVDHTEFTDFDSVYRLAQALGRLWWSEVHVASRCDPMNAPFWQDPTSHRIWTRRVNSAFCFEAGASWFLGKTTPHDFIRFDGALFKIEPPLDVPWLIRMTAFGGQIAFINSPTGMMEAASKLFLDHFADHIPGFSICRSVADAREQVRQQGSIVFKPAFGSGGRGLMRVDPNGFWTGEEYHSHTDGGEIFDKAIEAILPCVTMTYLAHVVDGGDKRIIVFDGKIMGAILRLPEKGHWLANMQQGGHLERTTIEPEEREMVAAIAPVMRQFNIAIYGVDTLLGNDGKRVMSEINAANPDGLVQAQDMTGTPVIKPLARAMRRYVKNQRKAQRNTRGR